MSLLWLWHRAPSLPLPWELYYYSVPAAHYLSPSRSHCYIHQVRDECRFQIHMLEAARDYMMSRFYIGWQGAVWDIVAHFVPCENAQNNCIIFYRVYHGRIRHVKLQVPGRIIAINCKRRIREIYNDINACGFEELHTCRINSVFHRS